MAVMVFYRPHGEHARKIEGFLDDFTRRTSYKIERIDPDTREGSMRCRVYDIVEYPTIIATAKDGQLRNMWRGTMLPSVDEVSYYVEHSN